MRHLTIKNVLLCTIFCLGLSVTASGGEWYTESGPNPPEFDWQWFAPVRDVYADPNPKANEGYFFTSDRVHMWMLRPDRAPIGFDGPPVAAWLPNSVNYLFTDPGMLGNGLTANVGNATLSFLFPLVGGGANGFQFNGIDDAYTQTGDGWGNRLEFGRIDSDCGWLVSVLYDVEAGRTDLYGFDDKRLDQLGAGQGLDGIDGTTDPDGPAGPGTATNPVAAVPGTQAILAIDGLLAVPILFNDPFGLLLGFTDFNFNQLANVIPGVQPAPGDLAEDTNGDGVINEDDLVRIAVVFDDVEVQNRTRIDGIEVNAVRRKRRLRSGVDVEGYIGMRYMRFNDHFSVIARGGALGDSDWRNQADNRMIGPSFGLRASRTERYWTTRISAKFLAGANFLSIRQRGLLGSHLTTGAPGVPLGLGGNAFFHRLGDERFSPTGEFKADAAFQVTRLIKLRAGWTGTLIGNVARASNTVVYDLPQLGIRNGSEVAFSHFASFGFEINR